MKVDVEGELAAGAEAFTVGAAGETVSARQNLSMMGSWTAPSRPLAASGVVVLRRLAWLTLRRRARGAATAVRQRVLTEEFMMNDVVTVVCVCSVV